MGVRSRAPGPGAPERRGAPMVSGNVGVSAELGRVLGAEAAAEAGTGALPRTIPCCCSTKGHSTRPTPRRASRTCSRGREGENPVYRARNPGRERRAARGGRSVRAGPQDRPRPGRGAHPAGSHQRAWGRHEEAAADLRLCVGQPLAPLLQYEARLLLGREDEALGRRDEARDAFARASALYPGAQSPRLAFSQMARDDGDRAGAIAGLDFLSGRPKPRSLVELQQGARPGSR